MPALAHLVIFDPAEPITQTSKAQKSFQNVAPPNEKAPRYAYGALPEKADYFVLVSQTCDIARGVNIEPLVVAARAQVVKAGPRLEEARSSVRYFLLNEKTGLVVDISYIVQIEKPLLLTVKDPEYGPLNADVARDFRYWIGNRFSRPAFPDLYVSAVTRPMQNRMRELVQAQNPITEIRKHIREVRTVMPSDPGPYPLNIIVLLDPTGDSAEEAAFKTGAVALFGDLISRTDRSITAEPTIYPVLANEWPVSEYWATEPLDLDIDSGDLFNE